MITNANTHIFGKDNTPESNLLTLTIMSPGTTKLALIKIIKEITSLGLMESKDIVDNSLGSIQIIKFHYQDSGINSLRNSLDNCADLKYTLTSLNQIRNRKRNFQNFSHDDSGYTTCKVEVSADGTAVGRMNGNSLGTKELKKSTIFDSG